MSELRDLTAALRAFDTRIGGVEECLLVLVRNSEQQAEWRHQQRNEAQAALLARDEQERAVQQIQVFCGSFSGKLAELVERLDNHAAVRLSDVKELRDRVRELEAAQGNEEITQP